MKTAILGEVADFVRGVTFKPTDIAEAPGDADVRCLRTKNVQEELDLSDVWAIDRSFVRREEQVLQPGDVLVSTANSWNLVGKCAWVPELPWESTFGGFVTALRPRRRLVEPRYLYRWLSWGHTQAVLRSFGQRTTSISNMNIERCRSMPIPLPSIAEQRRIAAIVDKADDLRAKRRAALAHLDALTQSIFLDMFGDPGTNPMGWDVAALSDVVASGTIVTYGIVQAGEEFPGGIPYIRTGDIAGGRVREAGLRRTDPEIARAFGRSRVSEGDIVMSIRATVGTTAPISAALAGANLTQGTARIAPGPTVTSRFLLQLLRSSATQQWLSRQVKGATFREITLARLRELPVLVPSLELQRAFDARARAAERATESRPPDIDGVQAR